MVYSVLGHFIHPRTYIIPYKIRSNECTCIVRLGSALKLTLTLYSGLGGLYPVGIVRTVSPRMGGEREVGGLKSG